MARPKTTPTLAQLMVIFRKIVAIIAAIIFFSIAYSYVHINEANMPRVPNPTTGRTYLAIVSQGAMVYVTEGEMLRKEHIEQDVAALSDEVAGGQFVDLSAGWRG
jgi:TRAP-type C4-dicarboxylate transport system permease small subunit